LVTKRSRRGKVFYSCNRYPDCDFAVWSKPLEEPCPNCGGLLTAQAGGKAKCAACGSIVEDGVLVKVGATSGAAPEGDGRTRSKRSVRSNGGGPEESAK